MGFEKHYEARSIIENFLQKDLVGPVNDNEIIEDEPLRYYTLGRLFPQQTEVDHLETAGDELDDIQEAYDASISLSNAYSPSSMAVSFTVKNGISRIKLTIKGAQYTPIEEKIVYKKVIRKETKITQKNPAVEQLIGEEIKASEGNNQNEQDTEEKYRIDYKWKRVPFPLFNKLITIGNERKVICHQVIDLLEVQVYIQKIFDDGTRLITVALVNKNMQNNSQIINNTNSYFQPELLITAEDEQSTAFIEKRMQIDIGEDKEIRNFNMLYYHVRQYAVGHGCSVTWKENGEGAYQIQTTFLPEYELKQMKPAVKVESPVYKMSFLAEGSKDEICSELTKLVLSYGEWIMNQKDKVDGLPDIYNEVAFENIELCLETKSRLEECIKMLKKDNKSFEAFRLANKAMLKQREQLAAKENRLFNPDKVTWYPFQLAFIMQELPSIIEPNNDYRKIVDLLWFPTGGGKTEAYLGLSAFTVFLRRLQDSKCGGGVTIIMRYTLRLLTMQQFERASTLICACEQLRKDKKVRETLDLGNDEISIGLWVGGGLTPNNLRDTEDILKKVKRGENVTEGNPCQILVCPWCGSDIKPDNYELINNKLKISCPSEGCSFYKGLPLFLVDEDIYNNKPTLIIGTVDKFARMTWEPKVGSIFGINTPYKPPELVIQDELHLISGPLGTITGLYELAIMKFCENNNIGAKIIASTATIRKAEDQILSLYGKDYRQFPPQGVNIRDSYFAEESTPETKPSRKYIGCLAAGSSATTTLVRVYACLLYATRYLKDKGFDNEIVDSYWTLTGYFNSLRELGGAVVQVIDDVQDRFEYLYATKFKDMTPEFTMKRRYDWYTELTSRKSNAEIGKIIQKDLKVKYPSKGAFDFILASNMLSVGVDVGRLGIMAVTGQPKTNAEYIQASSRVGRENPGLVLILYNPSHSRDRSHYEQFVYYHSAIYKFVEATSLTPFSDRARERALHAVYISLCRHLISGLRYNDNAANFDIELEQLNEIERYILSYVENVDGNELEDAKATIEEIKEIWLDSINSNLVYAVKGKGAGKPLLKSDSNEYGVFDILNSMRNVDAQSNVFLLEG